MKNTKLALSILAIAASAALTACGGGGGGGSSSGGATTPPPATPPTTPPASTLNNSPTAGTYAAGSMQATTYSLINSFRASVGVGQLNQDTILDLSAGKHATYQWTNFASGALTATTHDEISTLPDFYATTPLARAELAGAPSTEWISENAAVGAPQTSASDYATDCFNQYVNTVYHLQGLTNPVETIGIGFAQDDSTHSVYSCVYDMGQTTNVVGTPQANAIEGGAGQQLSTTAIVTVPYNNETNVARAMVAESPNPAPDLPNPGRPIVVRMNAASAGDAVTVSSFTITPQGGGSPVTARIIIPSGAQSGSVTSATVDVNGELDPGVVVLLPETTLAANTTYNVSFSGARDAQTATATWSFTTGN
jgi:uncharacterized protein YkwD